MITTGTKLLLGSALATALFAAVYGIANGGALGTLGLTSIAFGLAVLAAANIAERDSNVSAMDHDAFASAPANQISARPSLWPLLTAIGATMITIGLVTNSVVFVLGCGAVLAGAVEWMIQGWSEHTSDDSTFNNLARRQLAQPLELPVGAAILAGVIAYSFSRVMLGLPSRTATVIAFGAVAALVMIVGAILGTQRSITKPTMTGVFTVGVLAIAVAGTSFGIAGPREVHEHETTADLAEEDLCGTEETHADENASHTVAAKSNVAADITFDGANLTAVMAGPDDVYSSIQVPRANITNVIFHNESDGPARLVVDLHPAEDSGNLERVCTTLLEEGGSQFLTVNFLRTTQVVEHETGQGYAFTVPGSDASLEVVVP